MRAVLLLSAVVMAASTCLAAPPQAQASTAGALSRCNSFQRDDHSAQVVVPGNGPVFVGGGPRQDPLTPLRDLITPGDVVGIFATGQVSYGGFLGSAGTWGPNGNGRTAPLNSAYPFPGGPQYALVGTWHHSQTDTRIGSLSACLVVPSGGDGFFVPWGLWLLPNDDGPGDNGGSYRATVHVWRAHLSP